jgi:hypothetical protein
VRRPHDRLHVAPELRCLQAKLEKRVRFALQKQDAVAGSPVAQESARRGQVDAVATASAPRSAPRSARYPRSQSEHGPASPRARAIQDEQPNVPEGGITPQAGGQLVRCHRVSLARPTPRLGRIRVTRAVS